MTSLWVDTDFGFDDLWALLLLHAQGVEPAGISLVAGNVALDGVVANALGAASAYGFDAPVHAGVDRPLKRRQETAQHVLGPRGMRTRGQFLPAADGAVEQDGVAALEDWLQRAPEGKPRNVLALGPLTNIATLIERSPAAARKITRLVWMGGSNGPGNHSAAAEFNALADPDAAAIVAGAGLRLDVIDLMICRQVTFDAADIPETDRLTADLLGGYLDIGLERGRSGMAIYDPVAALAMLQPQLFVFQRCAMQVSVADDDTCGATRFIPSTVGYLRLAIEPRADIARLCLDALAADKRHGA